MAKKASGAMTREERLKQVRDKLARTDISGARGFYKPVAGRNMIRILPGVGEMGYSFWMDVGKHYIPGARRPLTCRAFTLDEPCPVCEFIKELYQAGDDESKALASKMGRRKQFWMNVIDRKAEDRGVLIYTPGPMVFGQINSIINDPDYGDVYDIEDGVDLIVTRTGEGIKTKYTVMGRRKSTPLHADPKVVDEWLNAAMDLTPVELTSDSNDDMALTHDEDGKLDAIVTVMPYDRMVHEFDGIDIEEEEEESEEEIERRLPFKKRKASSDDNEDEEEFDEDEEEEEDMRTVVKRRRAAKKTKKPARRRRVRSK